MEIERRHLRRLIEQHGSLTGTAARDYRVRSVARLRSVVKSLLVSTEGDRPKLGKTRALFEQDDPDQVFADLVMRRSEEVGANMQRFNPGFRDTSLAG